MKKNKKIILSIMILITLLSAGVFFARNNKKEYIDKVLSTPAYSYLSPTAKEFVKDSYERTGELVLTEKNKVVGTPYLNPKYVDYLDLDNNEKKQVELIPSPYALDYNYAESSSNGDLELPERYDLRNVDGKRYITKIKNQGGLGLCWAFATIEQAESFMMVTNNEEYNENTTKTFSIRQLDYLTSKDGIINFSNAGMIRDLGQGGNFHIASEVMSLGLSLFNESEMPYTQSLTKKKLYEIYNYNKSNYEVTGTVELPTINMLMMTEPDEVDECNDIYDQEEFEQCYNDYEEKMKNIYINEVKNGIINYGGAYVGAVDSESSCAHEESGTSVIDIETACSHNITTGHALQVIGWDDNYEYKYCLNRNIHFETESDGTCANGKLITGQGAFILRNSWGEYDNANIYPYLTYNSINTSRYSTDFSFITSWEDMKNRTWDNVYTTPTPSVADVSRRLKQTFTRTTSSEEKLEKIKFSTYAQGGEFSVEISNGNDVYKLDDTIYIEYPGIYTIDLSEKNINLKEENFTITIKSVDNSKYLYEDSIAAFTSTSDQNPEIITKDITVENKEFGMYSETRNIESGEILEYKFFDGDTDISENFVVEDNIVAANNINTSVRIIGELNSGEYKVKIKYNNYETEATLNLINDISYIEGEGNEDNPYLIHNEKELNQIRTDLNAFYKLESDIELTNSWKPIGTSDKPFKGVLDGNGHSITGLKINDSTLQEAGLFGRIETSYYNDVYIKNLTLKDVEISTGKTIGALVGSMKILQDSNYETMIDSVFVIGGILEGNTVGGLLGEVTGSGYGTEVSINNIFTSCTINNAKKSGIIGSALSYEGDTIMISNIQNVGKTILSENIDSIESTKNGSIIGEQSSPKFSLENFSAMSYAKAPNKIYNHLFGDTTKGYSVYGVYLSYPDNEINYETMSKVYGSESAADFTEMSKYQFSEFSKYWELKTIDDIPRIAVLKGAEFEYTKVNEITVDKGDTISLLDYIEPETEAIRIKYDVKKNDDIVEINTINDSNGFPIDITILGKKSGTATIHLISNHDGFEKDIEITVPQKMITVTYYSDENKTATYAQEVENNEEFTLNPNTFVKEGYKFKEWNTKADGSGTTYTDEQVLNLDKDLVLYAQWEKEPTPITNISLNETEISLTVGQDDTKVLKATLEPSNTTQDTTVTWSSSDTSVAKVNQSGKVTAVAKGEAVITATTSNGKKATCAVTVKGKTGWVTENSATYYYDDEVMQKGITEIDGNKYLLGITSGKLYTSGLATITSGSQAGTYYTNSQGIIQTGQQSINGETYYFDPETGKMLKGIIQVGENKYLYGVNSGKLYTSGLATITYGEQEGTYYTNNQGIIQTGQQKIGNNTYYFDETGKMQKGIIQVGDNKYLYGITSGKLYTNGLATITSGKDEGTYYTNKNGVIQTGQQSINGETYYFDPETGKMQKGIIEVEESRYLYGVSSGKLYRDGLATITYGDQAGTYITDEEGIVQTGWIEYKGEKYYSKEDGKLVKGVQKIGEESYLFGVNSFKLYYGLASTPDGKTYYSNSEGVLQKGTFTINGKKHTFGNDYSQIN